ncbi:hypothetical protein FQZ97_900260 [compost metagenome]
MAMSAEKDCASGPKAPRCAAIDSAEASTIAPTPTGLTSYRCARLNSMPGGDQPSGLFTTRSATTAMIHAMAMLEYRPSTWPKAWKTFISISRKAMKVLKTTQTTRPGWLCVAREKKLDQASEPAYALVTLIFSCDTTTNSAVAATAHP